MLIAVNYHYVRPFYDARYPGIHGITPSRLESHLAGLGRVATFVSGDEVRAAAKGGPALSRRSVLITFDDGLREQFEYALPILSRLGVPAMFFVNTAPVADHWVSTVHKIHLLRSRMPTAEFRAMLARHAAVCGAALDVCVARDAAVAQYPYDPADIASLKYLLNCVLTPDQAAVLIEACFEEAMGSSERELSGRLYMGVDQLRTLHRLGYLGSHGHEHLPLGLLTAPVVERQIRLSMAHLEAWTGLRPYALSYPYGSRRACSREAGDVAAVAGIELAFTMERARIDGFSRPLHLPRIDCKDLPGETAAFAMDQLFDHVPPARWYEDVPVAS